MIYWLGLILFSFNMAVQADEPTVVEQRIQKEEFLRIHNLSLLSHRPNYLLPVTYNFRPNNRPYEDLRSRGVDTGLDRVMRLETKFQLSFKFPFAKDLFTQTDSLWAAYTQQSYWQVYNQNSSRPFRESNYEPELFYFNKTDLKFGDFKLDGFTVGFVHQSNGQTEFLSRSWNRIYLTFIFSTPHFAFSLKPWYRFSDGARDDNPNIREYLGNFEARMAYTNDGWTYSLLLRSVLKDDFKGYRELGVSFPIDNSGLKGFVQYANGYGESLLDYYSSTNRIGVGVIVSDFL